MQPVHRCLHRRDHLPLRQPRPVDHQDRQAEGSGSGDLGNRALATGVLGDDQPGLVLAQKRGIAGHIERPARHDHLGLRQGQRTGRRIDKAQKVVMLRLGGEGVQMLPPDGKEHAARRAGKGRNGGGNVGYMVPMVTFARHPRGAFQREKRCFGRGAGGNGIAAHLGRERVGGVDHMGDFFGLEIGAKALHAAKAADPHRDRLVQGCVRPACVGIDAGQARLGDGARQKARLGGAAEKKDACHV